MLDQKALLTLDNVQEPSLITSALPTFAGNELSCTILYTSRNIQKLPGVVQYEAVHQLFKLAAYFPEATPIPLWLLGLAAN